VSPKVPARSSLVAFPLVGLNIRTTQRSGRVGMNCHKSVPPCTEYRASRPGVNPHDRPIVTFTLSEIATWLTGASDDGGCGYQKYGFKHLFNGAKNIARIAADQPTGLRSQKGGGNACCYNRNRECGKRQ
jgi:hypothetical protein